MSEKVDWEKRIETALKPIEAEHEKRIAKALKPVDEVGRIRRELKEEYGVEQKPPKPNPPEVEEEYERVEKKPTASSAGLR